MEYKVKFIESSLSHLDIEIKKKIVLMIRASGVTNFTETPEGPAIRASVLSSDLINKIHKYIEKCLQQNKLLQT